MNGIINVYKEQGFTSHDVVAKLRGILKTKKIGHTGTLDPDAEGVLPVCIGKATKLCDMLTDKDKTYHTILLLGVSTDTEDISGKVLKQKDIPSTINDEKVREVINSFIGDYSQIPPMYSALKVNGKKLYELARQGVTVERKPRNVQIHDICIHSIELPRISMDVSCSKGTYIRTLCKDIGDKLGTGGCMEKLLRTKTGIFDIKDSIKLDDISKKVSEGTINDIVMPIDYMFSDYRSCTVRKEFNKLIYNGNIFKSDNISQNIKDIKDNENVKVYDEDDNFIGIYKYSVERNAFIPVKMFLTNEGV